MLFVLPLLVRQLGHLPRVPISVRLLFPW